MYSFVDAVVVRAATSSSCVDISAWPDLTGGADADVARWRSWLRQVWACDGFASAVEVASPVLAQRVQTICDGTDASIRQVRRAVLSVIRYLLRVRSRATPLGLFAGVAPARIGLMAAARFGEAHHTIARVDSAWLAEVTMLLESCPQLWDRLLVMGNNLAFVRDGRLVVGCLPQPSSSGGIGLTEVSVRHTAVVQAIMCTAAAPISVEDLAARLGRRFPGTSRAVIDGVLAELARLSILVTDLRSPTTVTDPLDHVVTTLAALPQVTQVLGEVRAIHADLARHNQETSPARQRTLRAHVAQRMVATSTVERPVTVDLRLDGSVTIPIAVAREVQAAAAALVRLTPHPTGPPAWQDYHDRFLERYGPGALVPLTDLVNPDTGLGFPAGYRGARLKPPVTSALSERDTALLILAHNAAMEQATEVVLDDHTIAELAGTDITALRVQPHTELSIRVHAPTLDALDRGEFELAVTGVSRAAGTTTGRFLDLLNTDERDRTFAAYANLPTINENAIAVQVSGPALSPRADNVARSLAVLDQVSISEHHSGEGVIPLDDLAVGGDVRRLYLVSLSQQRPVEPIVFNAVEFTNQAHPLLRFLCEISTARAAACTPFSWGAAHRLPFLPRIRYRQTILAPARWLLSATHLRDATTPWPDWTDRMTALRFRFRIPQTVYLGEDDRRIQLDLDNPAHLQVLRADLDRAGQVTLREAPDASAFGWIGGRAHEIVIPLEATAKPVPQPLWPRRPVGREHGHLPATSDWLYVKLYGHPDRQTTILTTHLPSLLSTCDGEPEWWFLRYDDPEPHLRLRFHFGNPDDFGDAARRIGAWTGELRRLGLVGQVQWDTYYPETGRFGHDEAMTAAESVFAADSVAVLAQLTATGRHSGPHWQAVTAASMVNLATTVTGSIEDGMRWLIEHAAIPSVPASTRQVHSQAIRLADPDDNWAALRAIPGGEHIVACWTRRCTALTDYRAALTSVGAPNTDAVLPDLLHLHHIRMTGISTDTERACIRLARAAALSWTARIRGAAS